MYGACVGVVLAALGWISHVLLDLENHHNFAWKEIHNGEEVIVHRKGATPAGEDTLGFIPGSMADPGYVVRGRGCEESLNSAAHGAGRRMSRTQAKKTFNWKDTNKNNNKAYLQAVLSLCLHRSTAVPKGGGTP